VQAAAPLIVMPNMAASTASTRPGRTPLHAAAEVGDTAGIEALLEDGAKVDAADAVGYTPLHVACIGGHEAAVEALLKAGANYRLRVTKGRQDRRRAALQLAERRGHTAVVSLLKEAEVRRGMTQTTVL
jgi:ankyrin repeat protein